jgi:hypothetical protein
MTAAAASIPSSRFARLPRSGAIALLVLLALAIAAGFLSPPAPTHMKHVQGGDDLAFYQAVVARVHAGQPYEAAAVAQLRVVHGPLRPFLAVRPPALAWILAALPSPRWGDWILEAMSLAVIAAWVARLRGLGWGPASLGAAAIGDGLGLRLAALLFGYTIGFMVIGRPENAYWGLVTAPLTAVGLCLAPTALCDLARRVAA